ncbi:putative E3 ubiquitin-protein ligase [Ascosphaera atra]|nr:putative E3 ubiquitin-protein ligase [Ascosphaera atra]
MGSNQGSAGHDPFLEPSSDEIAMQARMALSQSPQQMSPLKHSTPSSQLPKHRDGRRKSAREDQRRHNDVSAKPDGSVELRCMVCAHFNALAKREKCFRCSKCSTINDLIPYREPSRSDDQRDGRPESMPWNRVLPVTVDHTNAIISQCEYMYFCQLLRASLESTARPGPAKFAPPDGPCVRRDSPRVSSSAAKGDGKDSVNGSKSTKEVSDNAADSHQNTEKSPNRAGSPTKKRSANNQTQYRTRFSSRRAESIYKPLINYLHTAFDGCDTLNSSFLTAREGQENSSQPRSEGKVSSFIKRQQELDFRPRKTDEKGSGFFCTPKSPRIDWDRLDEWYNLVINVGASWREGWKVRRPRGELGPKETRLAEAWEAVDTSVLEKEVEEARRHVRQALLRVTEDLLKRPKRPLKVPDDVRFLLVLLANPLLFSADSSRGLLPARSYTEKGANSQGAHRAASQGKGPLSSSAAASKKPGAPVGDERDQYARVTKRILGIIANLNPDTQRSPRCGAR